MPGWRSSMLGEDLACQGGDSLCQGVDPAGDGALHVDARDACVGRLHGDGEGLGGRGGARRHDLDGPRLARGRDDLILANEVVGVARTRLGGVAVVVRDDIHPPVQRWRAGPLALQHQLHKHARVLLQGHRRHRCVRGVGYRREVVPQLVVVVCAQVHLAGVVHLRVSSRLDVVGAKLHVGRAQSGEGDCAVGVNCEAVRRGAPGDLRAESGVVVGLLEGEGAGEVATRGEGHGGGGGGGSLGLNVDGTVRDHVHSARVQRLDVHHAGRTNRLQGGAAALQGGVTARGGAGAAGAVARVDVNAVALEIHGGLVVRGDAHAGGGGDGVGAGEGEDGAAGGGGGGGGDGERAGGVVGAEDGVRARVDVHRARVRHAAKVNRQVLPGVDGHVRGGGAGRQGDVPAGGDVQRAAGLRDHVDAGVVHLEVVPAGRRHLGVVGGGARDVHVPGGGDVDVLGCGGRQRQRAGGLHRDDVGGVLGDGEGGAGVEGDGGEAHAPRVHGAADVGVHCHAQAPGSHQGRRVRPCRLRRVRHRQNAADVRVLADARAPGDHQRGGGLVGGVGGVLHSGDARHRHGGGGVHRVRDAEGGAEGGGAGDAERVAQGGSAGDGAGAADEGVLRHAQPARRLHRPGRGAGRGRGGRHHDVAAHRHAERDPHAAVRDDGPRVHVRRRGGVRDAHRPRPRHRARDVQGTAHG
mmetsp:Transcript_14665/g.31445  ORF Transcript_14665/g.31445 Transcript_14665/m.31445 type:complete len:693 (-) Transcript_14665:128-2206(-)